MIYLKIRPRALEACEQASPLNGSIEVDEAYFGAHRACGLRGRGASSKMIVFVLHKPAYGLHRNRS